MLHTSQEHADVTLPVLTILVFLHPGMLHSACGGGGGQGTERHKAAGGLVGEQLSGACTTTAQGRECIAVFIGALPLH